MTGADWMLCVVLYTILGSLLGFLRHKGEPEMAVILILLAWPFFFTWLFAIWLVRKTSWYKRRQWRQRLRIVVSEENESDESFLRRSKRI
jgi:hypothetical protein